MNIDFVFAFEADMRCRALSHKYPHTHSHTCAPATANENVIMQSTLCVPPTWQMHLLSKSWWIFSLNSKSKPHLCFPSLLREPLMSAMPPTSPSNHSLTKWQWKKTLLWILIVSSLHVVPVWCMELHVLLHMYTSYQMCLEYVVPLYWRHFPDFDKFCCDLYYSVTVYVLFSVFKVTLISLRPHSLQSTSAVLLYFFVFSTVSLPEWQLTEVEIVLIYFTQLWIFSVNRAVFMHGFQISCVLIRVIVWYVGLLNNSELPWH